jgi:hypothetical protein
MATTRDLRRVAFRPVDSDYDMVGQDRMTVANEMLATHG